MQVKERRQLVLLAVLLAVLVVVTWWQFGGAPATGPAVPTAGAAARRPTAQSPRSPGAKPDAGPVVVHLDWLAAARPEPNLQVRDPFAFGGGRVVAAGTTQGAAPAPVTAPAAPVGPPSPPPPPPIPYRFIGLLDAPGTGPVAVLSDGRFVYHGREGDIIDGRYRLVSVTTAAVQLEYLDGRGRQTLRLSGS